MSEAGERAEEILYSQSFRVAGGDFTRGGEVAAEIKRILKDLGIPSDCIRRLSIANFEAEMNVVMYAEEARVRLQVTSDTVRIVVEDRGPGIPDIELAMQPGWSTATAEMRQMGFGAGLGLPNIKKSADAFEIGSSPGVGTTLRYSVRFG